MKKILLSLAMATVCGTAVKAQFSIGGLPLAIQKDLKFDYVPVTNAVFPDIDKGIQQWNAVSEPKPALVALMTSTDFKFPNSGAIYNAENNTRIWKAQLSVSGAKALGLYYDHFNLPKGVKLFLSNADNGQILGAYTVANNDPSGKFATDAVEGNLVNVELDIDAGVNLDDIQLHIDRTAVFFAGIEYLQPYRNLRILDAYDNQLAGGSSVCMIDAICPLGNNYAVQRNATFQTLIPISYQGQQGLGACSSTMLNTTTNTPASCKQYFMLATHCEFTNAIADAGFAQIISRFNFQHSTCNPAGNPAMNTTQSITGAKFVARSVLPLDNTGYPIASQIKGDFLLLEFSSTLPISWGMNLAGWNNNPNLPLTNASPKKFIGFHHPGGDVKKVSSSHTLQSYAIGAPDSHWAAQLDSGLVAEGSSGSALFDGDGLDIGIASVAPQGQGVSMDCMLNAKGENVAQQTSNIILYSKLSYVWNYSIDGSANNRKLKPWLDPNNSGAVTVNALKSNCTPLDNTNPTGVTDNHGLLDQAFKVYPNPSINGQVTVQFNLFEPADLQLALYDISGKKLNTYSLKNTRTGSFNLDLSEYSGGVYLLQLSDGVNTASKKVMLGK